MVVVGRGTSTLTQDSLQRIEEGLGLLHGPSFRLVPWGVYVLM